MKQVLSLLLIIASVFIISSCKKCYVCTYPTCYACVTGGYTGTQYCGNSYTQAYLITQSTQCASGGGVWTTVTNSYTTQYCQSGGLGSSISNSIALSDAETTC